MQGKTIFNQISGVCRDRKARVEKRAATQKSLQKATRPLKLTVHPWKYKPFAPKKETSLPPIHFQGQAVSFGNFLHTVHTTIWNVPHKNCAKSRWKSAPPRPVSKYPKKSLINSKSKNKWALRIQICPKNPGISPIILFWGWDVSTINPTRSGGLWILRGTRTMNNKNESNKSRKRAKHEQEPSTNPHWSGPFCWSPVPFHSFPGGTHGIKRDRTYYGYPYGRVQQTILLMEEILHHLGCIRTCK